MGLETRVWRTGYETNLQTTVPKAVRVQLGLSAEDRLRWTVEGTYARVTKVAAAAADGGGGGGGGAGGGGEDGGGAAAPATYRLYKQTRGNSLYTTLPAMVVEQLRMSDRSRVEWELQGVAAHVRKA